MPDSSYHPISGYGAIGNLRTVALVARDGSVDWLCFPEMDSPSVFAAILDDARGGRFRVRRAGFGMGEQEYLRDTNVLITRFPGDGGSLTVTDFFPLEGNIRGGGASSAPAELHRVLHCEGGEVEVEVEWSPRFDYARVLPGLEPTGSGWMAEAGDAGSLRLDGLPEGEVYDDGAGPALRARFTLRDGERRVLVARWAGERGSVRSEDSLQALERTCATWRGWLHDPARTHTREWAGSWEPLLTRSELALKLVTHAETGAIAAAPTTSLPETIGGVRNWDYRYTWIRDAALTVQALIALDHPEEATEFLLWAERAAAANGDRVQIMYGLRGETELDEHELPHLEGYRRSAPVRIGNGAAKQLQLDVYGELLDSGYELMRRGIPLERDLTDLLVRCANEAAGGWERPDEGIWEVRSDAQHFTYSKLMSWVALDRAIHMAERFGLEGDVALWRRERERICQAILEHGFDREKGSFTQTFGAPELDASSLQIPLYELLPFQDPRIQGTIDQTLRELTENGMVYRYVADDGLPGKEGTFVLCTYWLVDCLALSRRLDEAWEIFEGMTGRANHLGLLSEQVDASTGELLGNFPQAFSHIGMINSLLYLGYAEGREIPGPAPVGTMEHAREMGREWAE
jgi:GH15 family glucan-1,4-alpha-glucosidase